MYYYLMNKYIWKMTRAKNYSLFWIAHDSKHVHFTTGGNFQWIGKNCSRKFWNTDQLIWHIPPQISLSWKSKLQNSVWNTISLVSKTFFENCICLGMHKIPLEEFQNFGIIVCRWRRKWIIKRADCRGTVYIFIENNMAILTTQNEGKQKPNTWFDQVHFLKFIYLL